MKLVQFDGIPQKGSRLVYGTGVPATWNDDRGCCGCGADEGRSRLAEKRIINSIIC